MTRHLLRLIWNRKRQNFLLTVEIFFSFLTLFGVVLFAVHYANNARQPLGFEIDRVWSIERRPQGVRTRTRPSRRGIARPISQLLMALRDLPQVEAVGAAFTGPYANSNWGSGITPRRRPATSTTASTTSTDSYAELLKIPIVEGRWFSREDDAATWTPVVVNRRLAREIFGDETAVGQIIQEERDPERTAARSERQARGQARHRRGRGLPPGRRAVVARELPVLSHAARSAGSRRRHCRSGSSFASHRARRRPSRKRS